MQTSSDLASVLGMLSVHQSVLAKLLSVIGGPPGGPQHLAVVGMLESLRSDLTEATTPPGADANLAFATQRAALLSVDQLIADIS